MKNYSAKFQEPQDVYINVRGALEGQGVILSQPSDIYIE